MHTDTALTSPNCRKTCPFNLHYSLTFSPNHIISPTMFPKIDIPSAKSLISAAASAAATAMLIRSIARDLIPPELTHYFFSKFRLLLTTFNNEMTLIVDEFDGLYKNNLFNAAHIYVSTLAAPSTTILRASLPGREQKIHVSVRGNEEIADEFDDIHLKWRMVTKKTQAPRYDYSHSGEFPTVTSETTYFKLTFHKRSKNRVIDEYLPHVLERSKAVREEKKTLKLHTLEYDRMHGGISPWQAVNLDHPAKFETLAMDDEVKSGIIDDLDRFLKRKEYYRKVGKAWKRGYLLFGPPGTGKSSLIAAMANYLNFDVYDLELTVIRCNSDLRRLLISTANRSILVVEDIDASIDLSERKNKATPPASQFYPSHQNRPPKVTLSGLLNFIDGLWSSMGDERIIIFTTNHKDKLDPALLRPGRMDVHIHMSYCTPCGFKMLANNYLSISEHTLLTEAEGLIASTKVTPAEVGEHLLKCDDPEAALRGLIKFLERKKVDDLATKQESTSKIKNVPEGLKELMKIANASSFGEMSEKIMKKDEAVDALKVLVEFLGEEIGAGSVSGSEIEDGIETL